MGGGRGRQAAGLRGEGGSVCEWPIWGVWRDLNRLMHVGLRQGGTPAGR